MLILMNPTATLKQTGAVLALSESLNLRPYLSQAQGRRVVALTSEDPILTARLKELPGVDEKDVQVTFDDGVLTIKGEKKTEKEETKAGYHVSERSYGSFLRTLDLPTDIDAEKISAKCVKGVLKITLPKLAEAKSKAKKIEIRGS